jgi:hypothetical protein
MQYVPSKRVILKTHPGFNEKWLQGQIQASPEVLGLGDLDLKDSERRQPRAGRLDVLLFDAENNTRYEVEIQLGATDESHIIRTLEYWDNERRRFPQYEHVAVIVAEEITGRFLNVINLFNQAIPLVAIQMSALEVNGMLTLHATKVLDLALPAPEEEDEPGQEVDRNYWLQRGSPLTVQMADQMLTLINQYGDEVALKYNKHYIGLQRDGLPDNFMSFRPRKKHLQCEFRFERDEELDARFEEAGLPLTARRGRYFVVQVSPGDLDSHRELLSELVQRARGIEVDVPPTATAGAEDPTVTTTPAMAEI